MAIFNPILAKPVAKESTVLVQTSRLYSDPTQPSAIEFSEAGNGMFLTGFQVQLSHRAPGMVHVVVGNTKFAELLPGGSIEIEERIEGSVGISVVIPAGSEEGTYEVMGYHSTIDPTISTTELPAQV